MPNYSLEGAKIRNVCIFSTLPGGYLRCVESIENYQLKISTVRRDYHHSSGATLPSSCPLTCPFQIGPRCFCKVPRRLPRKAGPVTAWEQSSTPPACDVVKLLCITKRKMTEQECDHLVAIARYAYRPPPANIREAVVHNAFRGKPKPSGDCRHIHLRPLVKLGTHEPGAQGGGNYARPSQFIRKRYSERRCP
jgi:hypothetical protein